MTRQLIFVTHADVNIDPRVAVTDWELSARGRDRHRRFAQSSVCDGVSWIASSEERKAREGAEILAEAQGQEAYVLPELHENDRSATGYLPREEFERVADAFFAAPDESVRGWETARAAQARIVGAVRHAATRFPKGDGVIVSHGGVGALLMCYALGVGISRDYDQPGQGGGNFFRLLLPDFKMTQGWTDIAAR